MLMDLFYAAAPVQDGRKLRIHFHSFMRDVLQQLHRLNSHCSPALKSRYDNNLVQLVAKNIAQQVSAATEGRVLIPYLAHQGHSAADMPPLPLPNRKGLPPLL